jgi:hypothetical protein
MWGSIIALKSGGSAISFRVTEVSTEGYSKRTSQPTADIGIVGHGDMPHTAIHLLNMVDAGSDSGYWIANGFHIYMLNSKEL